MLKLIYSSMRTFILAKVVEKYDHIPDEHRGIKTGVLLLN